ncbi:MAG: energy transducer TonB [Agarilytica sp.]
MNRFVVFIVVLLAFVGCENSAEISGYSSPLASSCSGQLAKRRSDVQISDSPSPWCISPAVYPLLAHQGKVEGFVLANFSVSKSGKISNIQVVESQPKGVFDQAAIDSLNNSFYVPSSRSYDGVSRRIVFEIAKTNAQP